MPHYTKTVYIMGTWQDKFGTPSSTYAKRADIDRVTNTLPQYWTKKRKGQFLGSLAYRNRTQKWIYPVGKFSDIVKTTGATQSTWSGCVYPVMASNSPPRYGEIWIETWPNAESIAMDNALDQNILEKIKAQKVNLGQAFGERLQTVRMIEQNVDRLVKGARALKRGDLTGFLNAIGTKEPPSSRTVNRFRRDRRILSAKDTFGNWWLEYTYGWKPLLSDIYGSMDAFSHRMDTLPAGYVRTTVKRMIEKSYKPGSGYTATDPYFSQTSNHKLLKIRRKGVYYNLNSSDLSVFTRSLTQLGLTNPLELAWELLPFSFVVDWFLPIGNYLGSLDATFGLTFVGGYHNYRERQVGTRTVTGKGPPGGANVYTIGKADDSYIDEYFSREIVTSFPSPVIPTLKNPLSVSHSLSSLALLNQIFKRW